MKIEIEDNNYHFNKLTSNELAWISTIKEKIFTQYPKLENIINSEIKKCKRNYIKFEIEEMLNKLIIANAKFLKDKYNETLQNTQFYKFIYKNIVNTLPYVLNLDKTIRFDRPFIYEPYNILMINLLNEMQKRVDEQINSFKNEYDICHILLANNIVRSIKSSIILFSIDDDAHGYSLYRGIIEQMARLNLAEQFKDEYVKLVKLNAILQMKKMGYDLANEDEIFLNDYIKENKSNSSIENSILYGWAKNKNGKSIKTSTEFIETSFADLDPSTAQILSSKIYHFASEFVHEDYVGVPYDFIKMRIQSKEFLLCYTHLTFAAEMEKNIKFNKYENNLLGVFQKIM